MFYQIKKRKKWYVISIIFTILSSSVIFLFPTSNYKIVNAFDLVWVQSLKSFSIYKLDGFTLFSIGLAGMIIVVVYLLIFSYFFNKKLIKKIPKINSKIMLIIVLFISLLIFIPSAELSLKNEKEIEQRGINKPAQWLMQHDPYASIGIEDKYASFSGGGMIQEYWEFMIADMLFWFPEGSVFVVNKSLINNIMQSNTTNIDYILSTHDLTGKYQLVADFYMGLEPAKRQENVDWHIYKIESPLP